jgi:hypothetical protein
MPNTESKAEVLYQHRSRKEWGLALLAWDRGDKRGYQFEDGKLRIFKEGFFGLLEEVYAPEEELTPVVGALKRRLGWKEQAKAKKKKKAVEGVAFEHQLALFQELYPKGFQGAKWAREKRGVDTTRRLQRHRDIAHVTTRKSLCLSRLNTLVQEGDFKAIIETMIEIGDTTDLVAKKALKPLEQLSEDALRELGERLFDLLHGDEKVAIRFERFVDVLVRAIGKQPSWQLATVYLALFKPREHICVKTRTARAQAACLGREITISSQPNAQTYKRLLAVTLDVEQRLKDAGLHPRDLLDVYDFMETTLSPKSLKRIQAMSSPETERAAA